MSRFSRLFWSTRDRPPRESVQERVAQWTLRTAWDVKGTVQKCPVKEKPRA
jgi:hypothetical protein